VEHAKPEDQVEAAHLTAPRIVEVALSALGQENIRSASETPARA